MLLSMWILYDNLKMYDRESDIFDGERCMEGVRLVTDEQVTPAADRPERHLLIGNRSSFFDTGAQGVVLNNGRDFIFIRDAELTDVMNSVLAIFERYNQWSSRIKDAQRTPGAFQVVLDIAHEMLHCPMFFGEKNMKILAITNRCDDENYFEEWDEIARTRLISNHLINRLKPYHLPTLYPDTVDPAVIPTIEGTPERNLYNYAIRFKVHYKGELRGDYYAFYKGSDELQGTQQILKYVTDQFEELLETQPEVGRGYSYCSELIKLLDGGKITPESIRVLYDMFSWDAATVVTAYKIVPSGDEFDRMIFDIVCKEVADAIPDSIVFPYRNTIIIIARYVPVHINKTERVVEQYMQLGNFNCGRSMPFSGLEMLPVFCLQAGIAITTGREASSRIHDFFSNGYAGYANIAAVFALAIPDWSCYVHRSFFELLETDITQGTEYFKTLYYFLKEKGHFGNTAEKLFIHRNTLTYRLARIQDVMGIDLHEESAAAYLRFCYEIALVSGITFPNEAAGGREPGGGKAE